MYKCPRSDLACVEVFRTTGDLDWHCHRTHGYRHGWRMVSSFGREIKLPIGPEPRRRVPDGREAGSGTPTTEGMQASATAAEARSKHRGRNRDKEPSGGRAKHRPAEASGRDRDGGRRAAKAGRGKHSASS